MSLSPPPSRKPVAVAVPVAVRSWRQVVVRLEHETQRSAGAGGATADCAHVPLFPYCNNLTAWEVQTDERKMPQIPKRETVRLSSTGKIEIDVCYHQVVSVVSCGGSRETSFLLRRWFASTPANLPQQHSLPPTNNVPSS